MPSWHELLEELKVKGSTYDVVRREYLRRLHRLTKRNVILYYSGWLQKPGIQGIHVNDADKTGLVSVIHKLDRGKGLDLILHTPGGETAATESIVDYLHAMFGSDIRAIVPPTRYVCRNHDRLRVQRDRYGQTVEPWSD